MGHHARILDENDDSLESRAPGLFKEFCRLFDSAGLALASKAFASVYANCRQYELLLARPAEANYNPKPARVAQILISELKETDRVTLLASLLACGGEAVTDTEIGCPSNALISQACLIANQVLRGEIECESSERIWLATHLDELRHIHMLRANQSDKRSKLSEIALKIGALRFPSNQRIHTLAKASIDRLERTNRRT